MGIKGFEFVLSDFGSLWDRQQMQYKAVMGSDFGFYFEKIRSLTVIKEWFKMT